jgi:hypothetical protein
MQENEEKETQLFTKRTLFELLSSIDDDTPIEVALPYYEQGKQATITNIIHITGGRCETNRPGILFETNLAELLQKKAAEVDADFASVEGLRCPHCKEIISEFDELAVEKEEEKK